MNAAYIVLAIISALLVILFIALWVKGKQIDKLYPDSPDKITVSKEDSFQSILEKFEVPADHYKIVIAQSRNYSVVNCPAVIWKDENKVKVLVLKAQAFVAEEDIEDFMYICSSPFVNFKQLDGLDFPDWARQSDEIKKLFLPYVEMTIAPGGIDRTRQQYWAGTICVYAPSMAEIFKMLGNPLSYYQITVDSVSRMREDGSIPADMLAQRDAEKQALAEAEAAEQASASQKDISDVWEAIKRLESRSSDVNPEDINKLNAYLISEKRFADLERSTTDKEFQKKLIEELLS